MWTLNYVVVHSRSEREEGTWGKGLGQKYLPATKSLPHMSWDGGPVLDEETASTQRPALNITGLACGFQEVMHLTPLNLILSNLPETMQERRERASSVIFQSSIFSPRCFSDCPNALVSWPDRWELGALHTLTPQPPVFLGTENFLLMTFLP